MEQFEQKQAVFQEELEQLKGNIDSMKGDVSKVLFSLKNIVAKQGETPTVAFEDVSQTIGTSKDHQPGLTDGFVPPPPKVGASHILQIPVDNPLDSDNYMDLQYGELDLEDMVQIPQQKALHTKAVRNLKAFNQFKALEERLKVVEGYDTFDVDALGMCLVPDVVIPPKFKVPDFEKYKGLTCPKNHVRMFCRKMTAYAHDEKLMIHCFQDSLSGASLEWYIHLERMHVRSWVDLAQAFLKQYKYNLDMAPNRMQLQNLSQKRDEPFKKYTQRWREMAARVQPSLLERELVDIFMSTLQGLYYEKMVGNISSGFSDLVIIGERIENGLRSGKIQGASTTSFNSGNLTSNFTNKEEGETNVFAIQQQTRQPWVIPQQQVQQHPYVPRQKRPRKVHDPIPMSHSQLLSHLLQNSLVELRHLGLPPFPYPPRYDPNAHCEFHSGAPGHTIEGCDAFKGKVRDLVDSGAITFTLDGLRIN
ncbi:uncharacterized protein LOC131648485 [Vicia villosa]|uniref:uncharacterized protein LOC131648485 n=1 Tax=Vicia villosa TaxID=3911 RepID=UPI00273CB3BA|nr:uncharacterized protein LOC131648485 [Vicia villosa]